jgi:NAD(P)-dependent dehydrogenase (short-subunit alcohol dehydrogenase family)
MAKAVSFFGRVDALVSNAGIQIGAPIEDFGFAKWKPRGRRIPVNLAAARLRHIPGPRGSTKRYYSTSSCSRTSR